MASAKSLRNYLVNLLLTILIKVNVPSRDMSRCWTTGDDYEVQESAPDPGPLVLAVRLRLERRWQHRLNVIGLNWPISAEIQTIYDSAWIVFSRA